MATIPLAYSLIAVGHAVGIIGYIILIHTH